MRLRGLLRSNEAAESLAIRTTVDGCASAIASVVQELIAAQHGAADELHDFGW